MIKKIYSRTLKSFKTIQFNDGFNFFVSESINEKSNNGTGKTSLIQIINFCFGSSIEKISTYDDLNKEEFSVDFVVNNKTITLSRTPQNANKIKVIDKQCLLSNEMLDDEPKSVDWVKNRLNNLIFGLENEEITFRNLISPFMKRGAFAFNNIYKTHAMETNIVTQLKNSFLMNVPIEPIIELKNLVEERESFLKLKEIKETDIIWKKENQNTLKSKIKNLNKEIIENENKLKDFELTLNEKTNMSDIQKINLELSNLIKEKYTYLNCIETNKKIINNNSLLSIDQIKEILEESSFFTSKEKIKTLGEIQTYHINLNKNRNERVKALIENDENKVKEIEEKIENINLIKSNILKEFDKKGYLDEYYSTNEIITNLKIEKSDLEKQLEVYKSLNEIDNRCKEKAESIIKKLKKNNNCSEFEDINNKFKRYIRKVFDEDAKLIMECKDSGNYATRGYNYDWEIPRKLSSGYLKGCIAVYDLVLTDFNSERFPMFLIHDSVVFESTDKQYVAKFLNLVNEVIGNDRFQYICCVNDDQIVQSELNEEVLEKYIKATRISQEDTLFGISFGNR